MSHRLSLQDTSFLRMETANTPMHVAALLTLEMPDAAGPDFLRTIYARLRRADFISFPFDHKLSDTGLRPSWIKADLDVDYHVRHSALPAPGGERELGVLVGRLHSLRMDMNRPLWELHLIDGLENRRFAIYLKLHHAAADGQSVMRMLGHWFSEDPAEFAEPPRRKAKAASAPGRRPRVPLRERANNARDLIRLLRTTTGAGMEGGLGGSLRPPRTLFNQAVTAHRRLATCSLPLERIKRIARQQEVSVNDVILGVLGGALRRYLAEQDALPAKTLFASVPVGRQPAHGRGENAASGFVCPLGTDEADPLVRLSRIALVTREGKNVFSGSSDSAVEQYTLLGLVPMVLGQMSGLLAKAPPLFNLTVSNVVASRNPLYFAGARLEAFYPVSFLLDGYALNVSLVGYCDRVCVGFVGCRDRIPHLQRLAVYASEALEDMAGLVDEAMR